MQAEDEQARRKVESKNTLENYAYSVRNSLRDEKARLSAEEPRFSSCMFQRHLKLAARMVVASPENSDSPAHAK